MNLVAGPKSSFPRQAGTHAELAAPIGMLSMDPRLRGDDVSKVNDLIPDSSAPARGRRFKSQRSYSGQQCACAGSHFCQWQK
jgi:hypothetical protein